MFAVTRAIHAVTPGHRCWRGIKDDRGPTRKGAKELD
jgi:hypothetical protein